MRTEAHGPGPLIDTAEAAESSELAVRRPKLMARVLAGVGVVVAALVPIAALVFFLLHVFNAVTFT